MCIPSAVASAAWNDTSAKYGSRVSFLGIVGDQSHATRVSGHNCGGLQESAIRHPDTGVTWAYPDAYAHALDIGHGGNRALAREMRNLFLSDPYKRVRYVIDNGIVYNPDWRGGGTSRAEGHTSHIHVSFTPWSTHDTRQFFGPPPVPLFPIEHGDRGLHILFLEIALVHCGFPNVIVDGKYGIQSAAAVSELKHFLHRGSGTKVTEADYSAIMHWNNLTGPPWQIKTLNDRGIRIEQLNRDLKRIGQSVGIGDVYTLRTLHSVQNVQRFWNRPHQAGNATPEDRAFIHDLAENERNA